MTAALIEQEIDGPAMGVVPEIVRGEGFVGYATRKADGQQDGEYKVALQHFSVLGFWLGTPREGVSFSLTQSARKVGFDGKLGTAHQIHTR
jgi:hypothetical protein